MSTTHHLAAPLSWRRAPALALALSACATMPAPVPVNLAASAPQAAHEIATNGERDVLFVTLSGGGARAAAFSLGALQELRDTPGADGRPLTDHVALVSSVSGGSITAAYYGHYGATGLDNFRTAYLDKDWAADLRTSFAAPMNWRRAWSGALNGPNRFADWLDREVLDGAAIADLAAGPQIWLNATDLYNGVTFAFTPLYFDAVCADLASVRAADAVAASMAFPMVFRPVLVAPHPEACAPLPHWASGALLDRSASALERVTARAFASYRDPAQLRYVHLGDGGIVDNLGLSSITLLRDAAANPNAPLSARDAARLRRLTVLVVNAEKTRNADWPSRPEGPNGPQTIDALLDIYIEDGNRDAYDIFRAALAAWRDELVAWRCALPADEARALTEGLENWACADLAISADMISFRDFDPAMRDRLGQIATSVTIPVADIDALIEGGRAGVRMNEEVRVFALP